MTNVFAPKDLRTPEDFLGVLDELGEGSVEALAEEARAVLEDLRKGVAPFPKDPPVGTLNARLGWSEPREALVLKEKRRSFFKLAIVAALWRIGGYVGGAGDQIKSLQKTLAGWAGPPVLRAQDDGDPEKSFFDGYLRRAIAALHLKLPDAGLGPLATAGYSQEQFSRALSAAVSVETLDWVHGWCHSVAEAAGMQGARTLREVARTLWRTWQSHFKPVGNMKDTVVLPTGTGRGAARLPLELHLRPLLAQVFEYEERETASWSGTLARDVKLTRLNRVDSDSNRTAVYYGRDILHVRYALLAEQLLEIYAAIADLRISRLGDEHRVRVTPETAPLGRRILERIEMMRSAQGSPPKRGTRNFPETERVEQPPRSAAAGLDVRYLWGGPVGLVLDEVRRHSMRSWLSVGLVNVRANLPAGDGWMDLCVLLRKDGRDSLLPVMLEDIDPEDDADALHLIRSTARENPEEWQRLWLDDRSLMSVDEVRAALTRPDEASFLGYGGTGAGRILLLLLDPDVPEGG